MATRKNLAQKNTLKFYKLIRTKYPNIPRCLPRSSVNKENGDIKG